MLTWVLLELLEEEVKRLLGPGDDELLHKVLEELVHLELLQLLLDALHVVELL